MLEKEDLKLLQTLLDETLDKTLDQKLAPIHADIKELKKDVTVLKEDVSTVKNDVVSLKEGLRGVRIEIIRLENKMDKHYEDVMDVYSRGEERNSRYLMEIPELSEQVAQMRQWVCPWLMTYNQRFA